MCNRRWLYALEVHVVESDVSLIGPNTVLTGTHNTDIGLYYMDLQSIEPLPVAHISQHSPFSNNFHTLSTKSVISKYLHQSAFSPVVSTCTATITSGLFTTWPGLTSALVRKHFPKSVATAKGHLRQDQQNLQSTRNASPTTPISNPPFMTTLPLPSQTLRVQTQMAYL